MTLTTSAFSGAAAEAATHTHTHTHKGLMWMFCIYPEAVMVLAWHLTALNTRAQWWDGINREGKQHSLTTFDLFIDSLYLARGSSFPFCTLCLVSDTTQRQSRGMNGWREENVKVTYQDHNLHLQLYFMYFFCMKLLHE